MEVLNFLTSVCDLSIHLSGSKWNSQNYCTESIHLNLLTASIASISETSGVMDGMGYISAGPSWTEARTSSQFTM